MSNHTIRQGLILVNDEHTLVSDVTIYVGQDEILSGPGVTLISENPYKFELRFDLRQVSGVAEPHEERRITPIDVSKIPGGEIRVTAVLYMNDSMINSETNVITKNIDLD